MLFVGFSKPIEHAIGVFVYLIKSLDMDMYHGCLAIVVNELNCTYVAFLSKAFLNEGLTFTPMAEAAMQEATYSLGAVKG